MPGVMQHKNPELERLLSSDIQPRYEPNFAWKGVCSQYLALTGLRGFWPMSSFNESGNAYDLSGQGRTLTRQDAGQNTVLYGYTYLIPWVENGTGEHNNHLKRTDEAGLDISGTETYVASGFRGLTLGGWFRAIDLPGIQGLITKWQDTNQRAYALYYSGSNACFSVSKDCSNYDTAISSVASSNGTWYFVAGRFVPGVTLDVYVYDTKDTEPTTLDSICDSDADLCVLGFHGGISLFYGRASMCFLCASALSDSIIYSLYQQSRAMFGIR